jgi:hypothetical protein
MGEIELAVIEISPPALAPPGFELTESGNRCWAFSQCAAVSTDPGVPVYIITDNIGLAASLQGYGVDDDIWYVCDSYWLLVAAPSMKEGVGFMNYLRRNGTTHTWQKEFESFRQSTAVEIAARFEVWKAIVAIADRPMSECGNEAKGTAA